MPVVGLEPTPVEPEKPLTIEQQLIEQKRKRDSNADQAYIACRNIVRQGMVSNTKLAGIRDYRYEYSADDDHYIVYSWLEGQNGFGAWLKKQYRCTVTLNAETNDWDYVDFEMFD